MLEKFLCPDCKGSGWNGKDLIDDIESVECDYCLGTGYAVDAEDDPMFSYEEGY